MNLWVKRTGQLFIAALFLMACEDDSLLLGFKNPNNKFNVKYQEFLVGNGGSVISVDPEITDNASGTLRLLIGEHEDPIVGTVRAEAFAEFLGSTTKLAEKDDYTYIYDSIILQLHLDKYSFGLGDNGVGKFNIHRIEAIPMSYTRNETHTIPGSNVEIVVPVTQRYYANSSVGYAPEILGETRFERLSIVDDEEIRSTITIDYDLLNANDTLLAAARLDDAFGLELFTVALNDTDQEFSDPTKFRSRFPGLAIIPKESNAVLGINHTSTYTRVKLYYHSELEGEVVDTLSRNFGFTGVNFHSITPDRINGLPPVDPPYEGVVPGTLRVVQAGYPLVTKIDLNSFYEEFAEEITEKNLVISSAELVIESVTSSDEYNPLQVLELRLMDEDDKLINFQELDQTDRDSLAQFYIFTNNINYYVTSDVSLQVQSSLAGRLLYNSAESNYSGSITLFIQSLFDRKSSQYRPRYLGLFPGTAITGVTTAPSPGKIVNRTAFQEENIKLRVYFSEPNNPNL